MKKASKPQITRSKSQKAAAKHQAAVNRAMKNHRNRPWNMAPKVEAKYVMKGGVPHKLVDGVFVPLKRVETENK